MASEEPQPQSSLDGGASGNRTPRVATEGREPNPEPWYAVRCVFRWKSPKTERPGCLVYEERIVLVRAHSFEEAHERGEAEAREYAAGGDMELLDFSEVFHLFDRKITDRIEVFSLLRESPLPPDEYVKRFFATGEEQRGEE